MTLDLMDLKRMHPLLAASTATEYGHRAAVALESQDHAPGVELQKRFDNRKGTADLQWVSPPASDLDQFDRHRLTEDAAEAIALALVNADAGWVVRRRIQRGKSADWLLHDPEARSVALEVSGTATGDDAGRLREKLKQVARARFAAVRAACVVKLKTPRATVITEPL